MLYALCLFRLCTPGLIRAEETRLLPDPGTTQGFVGIYRSVVKGEEENPFFQTLALSVPSEETNGMYDFRMKMEWPDGGVTLARSLLRGGDGLRSVSTLRTDFLADGRELQREEVVFSPSGRTFPADTYSNFAIYFALQGLAATRSGKTSLFMLVPSAAVARLKLRCFRNQRVTVPAGRFRCTKVVARTDLGYFIGGMGTFLNFIGYSFIPKSVLWYMEEEPHLLVRYRGMVLASPRNVPMEMELVRWSRNETTENKTVSLP
jgi:hypothetical protein